MAPQQKVHQYLLLSFEDLIYTKLYLSDDNTKYNNLILQSSKRNFTSSIDTGAKNTKTLEIKNEARYKNADTSAKVITIQISNSSEEILLDHHLQNITVFLNHFEGMHTLNHAIRPLARMHTWHYSKSQRLLPVHCF